MKASVRSLIALAAISVASSSFAQTTLYTYDFATVTTASGTSTPGGAASHLNFSSVTANGVANNPNAAGLFSFVTWSTGATTGSDTFTGALDPTDYFEFSITPESGYSYSLASLTFNAGRSATGPRQYVVRSSADNYASNLAGTASAPLTTVGSNIFQFTDNSSTNSVAGQSITLSGSNFTSLTNSLTFRFYAYNAEAATGSFRIDNLAISGTTAAIPEPSTYAAIFGVVALIGVAIRRRQQAKAASLT